MIIIADFTSLKPWYEKNISRDLYFSIKESSADQKVPDKLIKAALLKWAAEDVQRLIKMREGSQVLMNLHQRGSVGDNLWTRYTTSEKLLMLDLNELAREAEAIKPGWSQQVIQLATEITQNQAIRKRISEVHADTEYREALEALSAKSVKELQA